MENRRRLRDSASESTASIGAKLTRLASWHDQVKVAYQQLKSQIKSGLGEAEDVFYSLVIPSMKLVGLKTEEMAEEGRFNTIVVDADFSPGQGFRLNCFTTKSPLISPTVAGGEWSNQTRKLGKSGIHFLYLSSVEDNMEGLVGDLSERMCIPMVEYVKGLKADLKIGTCARLLDSLDEIERSMRNSRNELEKARKMVRLAEEGRINALCKLKETEEKVTGMKECYEFLVAIQKEHIAQHASHKTREAHRSSFCAVPPVVLRHGGSRGKRQQHRKTRRFRTPGSPMGPKELLYFESNSKQHQSTRARPSLHHRPVVQSNFQALASDTRMPLGLSPSSAVQRAGSRKRINPWPLSP
ncbi:uncharacterized protein LOC120149288 [Hibiscus syriacus]|uniref:uncharacterized protein LOC120149288 n=1 Tax=Hibiscus syriacus TaxID=106335 RepID=UPI0019219FB3|nr:uncharacterized protein LOC120149288 [Hibiscus syriacus]